MGPYVQVGDIVSTRTKKGEFPGIIVEMINANLAMVVIFDYQGSHEAIELTRASRFGKEEGWWLCGK